MFVDLTGKKILICYIKNSLNEVVSEKPWRKSLLDCVCKYWEIPNVAKANAVDFIVGVDENKCIVVVAKLNAKGWQKVSELEIKNEEPVLKNKSFLNRYAFEGEDISKSPESKKLIGAKLPDTIKFEHGITYPLYCDDGKIIPW
ncbi:hypothetical protein DYE50_03775 [Treponema ruminis]|uniref:Uncharacterized protein n=1 Tax=Treponema ruminis TaxID=744515 RepID=A0A7W8G7U9_9SPIR|nr:hypothetical protein [Treponema ruminis]MBB5225431.1 hypothetical protein [Treponema ruminis]QSI01699.1 hypothetical protein DYE50_03775 [Treponema ruminis]